MLQADIDWVRAGYDAFNRGDTAAWLDNFEPDAELRELPTTPGQRVYHGRDGLLQWAESMMQAFADYRFEPQEITEVGNFIVVAVRISARGLGSGVPTDMQVFHVFERSANGLMQSIAGFLSWKVEQLIDLGDQVVVLARMTGKSRTTGASVDWPFGGLFGDFRDGMFAETRYFMDQESALEAVGLSEQDARSS